MTHVVCLNAWHFDEDGNETYSDPATDPIDGWSVYRRVPDPRGPHFPFDSEDEADFEIDEDHDEEAARAAAFGYATALAAQHGIELQEY